MSREIIPSLKLAGLIIWLGLWYFPIWIAFKLHKTTAHGTMVMAFNRGFLAIIGFKLHVKGTISADRPLLLIVNHLSYLDIPIIASCLPVIFTPKSDIASWPVISNITTVSGAVYIDRKPEKMLEMKQALQKVLATGRVVCLFPEATTGNGLHLQPFKSGFFSLAEDPINGAPLTIQPACIRYTHQNGLPITWDQWPEVAWYADMVLAPHVWQLLKNGPITGEITFLPPVQTDHFTDRKQLASHCQKVIKSHWQEIHAAP